MNDVLDWSELSPGRFEEFCAEVLWSLGFTNVRQIGASGDRGRDIVCERQVTYTEEFSERFTWLIQCKHTPRLDKASIARDLAAAVEHRPDVWWLMTSARVTPDFHDYLTRQSRVGIQPFRVGYVDGRLLTRLCVRFPALVDRYLPRVAKDREQTAKSAMLLMSRRRYTDAATLLTESVHTDWCRSDYLLACCFAQSAARGPRKDVLDRAWMHLTQAIGRNYLTYLHARFGWPLDRCRAQVYEDAELEPLRTRNEKKFRKIIGHTESSPGRCFPAHVPICTPAEAKPIGSIRIGDLVTSRAGKHGLLTARVTAVTTTTSDWFFRLNDQLETTPSQPIHTLNGWTTSDHLQVGDMLTTLHGPELLTGVAFSRTAPTIVYDLTVEPDHQFYAGGVLVHNKI